MLLFLVDQREKLMDRSQGLGRRTWSTRAYVPIETALNTFGEAGNTLGITSVTDKTDECFIYTISGHTTSPVHTVCRF